MRLTFRDRNDSAWSSERGEMASWLVLAAGLAAAAASLTGVLQPIMTQLAQAIGSDGAVEIATAPATGQPGPTEMPGDGSPPVDAPPRPDGSDPGGMPGDGAPPVDPPAPPIDPEQAREALEELGPYELSMQLSDARRDGDLAEIERLTGLLFDGIENMSEEEANVYLEELGAKSLLVALAFNEDGSTHPSVVSTLAKFGAIMDNIAGPFWSPDELQVIADILDVDVGSLSPEEFTAALQEQALNNVLAQPGVVEDLVDLIRDGDHYNPPAPQVSEAVLEWLLEDPERIHDAINLAQDDSSEGFQNILEVMATTATDGDMRAFLNEALAYEAGTVDSLTIGDGTTISGDLARAAYNIGQLQYQLDEVGSDASFDPTGVLIFLGKQTPLGTPIKALEAIIGGYTGDETYTELRAEDRESRRNLLLAIATVSAIDPVAAAEIEAALSANPDTHQAIEDWITDDSDVYQIVSDVAQEIENGITNANVN